MRLHPKATVFLVALGVRLAFVLPKSPDLMRPLEDQRLYLRMGRAWARGKGLTIPPREYNPLEGGEWKWKVLEYWVDPYDPGMGVAQEGRPTALIEPLYPILVGAVDVVSPGNVPLLRVIQAFLGALTALFLASAGATVSPTTGLLAGLGFALFPHAVYYTGMVTTETLFMAFQAAAFWLWARWVRTGLARDALVFGVASGCAFLARSAALPVAVVALGVAVTRARVSAKAVAAALGGFCVAVAPWVVRNGIAMGEYRLMPTKDGLNLWMQNHPGIQQLQLERIGLPIPQGVLDGLRCRELEEFPRFSPSTPEVERNRVLRQRALRYLRCNPRYFLTLCGLRLRWYLRLTGSTVRGPLVDAVGVTSGAILLATGLVGAIWGRRHPVVCFSALAWVASLVMHALFHGGVRYRIPADSLLIVAAAAGVAQVWSWVRHGAR